MKLLNDGQTKNSQSSRLPDDVGVDVGVSLLSRRGSLNRISTPTRKSVRWNKMFATLCFYYHLQTHHEVGRVRQVVHRVQRTIKQQIKCRTVHLHCIQKYRTLSEKHIIKHIMYYQNAK